MNSRITGDRHQTSDIRLQPRGEREITFEIIVNSCFHRNDKEGRQE